MRICECCAEEKVRVYQANDICRECEAAVAEMELAEFKVDGKGLSRNLSIPADLMPRQMPVQKSTAHLLVGGVWWNKKSEETACIGRDSLLGLGNADHSPNSKATR